MGRAYPGRNAVTRVTAPILIALLIVGLAVGLLCGLKEDTIAAIAFRRLGVGGDPNIVLILASWSGKEYCPAEFRVGVVEDLASVRVANITRRSSGLGWVAGWGGGCVEVRPDGLIAVPARLDSPLNGRSVLNGDGKMLEEKP